MFERDSHEPLPRAPLYPLAQLIPALLADAHERHQAHADGQARGPQTGLPALDSLLGGALEPGLHVLHGAPGTGKSALALSMAAQCGCPALFVSAELSALEVLRRLIARAMGWPLGQLKTGELPPDDLAVLARGTVDALPRLGLLDATRYPAPTEHLAEALATLRNAPGTEDAPTPGALLVVDSAHTWSARLWPELEEYQRLAHALSELELLAQTLSVPLLLVAERNRASMASGGQSAAAGHRRFEYVGESVLALDPLRDAPEDTHGWREVALTVAKNRHGPCGLVPLTWQGATQRHRVSAASAGGAR